MANILSARDWLQQNFDNACVNLSPSEDENYHKHRQNYSNT